MEKPEIRPPAIRLPLLLWRQRSFCVTLSSSVWVKSNYWIRVEQIATGSSLIFVVGVKHSGSACNTAFLINVVLTLVWGEEVLQSRTALLTRRMWPFGGSSDVRWLVCRNERQTECGEPNMHTKNVHQQTASSAIGVSFHLFCILRSRQQIYETVRKTF